MQRTSSSDSVEMGNPGKRSRVNTKRSDHTGTHTENASKRRKSELERQEQLTALKVERRRSSQRESWQDRVYSNVSPKAPPNLTRQRSKRNRGNGAYTPRTPHSDEVAKLQEEIAQMRAQFEQQEQTFFQERIQLERERDAWRQKAQILEAEKKTWRDSVRTQLEAYRQEGKDLINRVQSVLVSMENASTARLARMNPMMNKQERIQFSNQTYKILIDSVKGVIQARRAKFDLKFSGCQKILDHKDFKELFTVLLVKFGSAMMYANNQASHPRSRKNSDKERVSECSRKIEELNMQISEMEESRIASEKVKQLLFQQVKEQAEKTRSREAELESVYSVFDMIKKNRKSLERNLKKCQENEQRLVVENKDLKNQLEQYLVGDLFATGDPFADDPPSIDSGISEAI